MGVVPDLFLKPMEPAVREDGGADRRRAGRRARQRRRPARCRGAPVPGRVATSSQHRRRTASRLRAERHAHRHHPHRSRSSSSCCRRCAVLLAESFRRPDDWMPVSWLGDHRHASRGIVDVDPALGPQRRRFRRHRRSTTTRSSSTSRSARSVCITILVSSGTAERDRPADRRVLRAHAVLDRRHDADGIDARSARHLHRASRSCRSAST